MGRKKHEALSGLAELGDRLRSVRLKAGLSQMRVSELMGFNPTHGYKYILKLEKGTVPNPTLRTIISYLEACGAGWTEVMDAMPGSAAGPAPAGPKSQPPAKHSKKPGRAKKKPAAPEPPRRRDPRPLRVRLRAERMAERSRQTRNLWAVVARTEDAVRRLLISRRVLTSAHHDYMALVRTICSTLDAFGTARPGVLDAKLERAIVAAAERDLDRDILLEIATVCRQGMKAVEEPET